MSEETDALAAATEIADEVQWHLSSLYPLLSLPFSVWETMREMIEREVNYHYGLAPNGADGIALDPIYIKSAIASGLRKKDAPE